MVKLFFTNWVNITYNLSLLGIQDNGTQKSTLQMKLRENIVRMFPWLLDLTAMFFVGIFLLKPGHPAYLLSIFDSNDLSSLIMFSLLEFAVMIDAGTLSIFFALNEFTYVFSTKHWLGYLW